MGPGLISRRGHNAIHQLPAGQHSGAGTLFGPRRYPRRAHRCLPDCEWPSEALRASRRVFLAVAVPQQVSGCRRELLRLWTSWTDRRIAPGGASGVRRCCRVTQLIGCRITHLNDVDPLIRHGLSDFCGARLARLAEGDSGARCWSEVITFFGEHFRTFSTNSPDRTIAKRLLCRPNRL